MTCRGIHGSIKYGLIQGLFIFNRELGIANHYLRYIMLYIYAYILLFKITKHIQHVKMTSITYLVKSYCHHCSYIKDE